MTQRKLAAILAADIVGFSRLMGADEAGTVAALKEVRRGIIDEQVASHGGRLVKATGDGFLVEFPSLVSALDCAVAIQCALVTRAKADRADQRIVFRIGVHFDDVILDDDDILRLACSWMGERKSK